MSIQISFQRLESAAVFIGATFIYFYVGLSLLFYLLFLFAFDLSMGGYLVNNRIGAIVYNIGHSYIIPALLIVLYFITRNEFLLGLICLWFAHIGLDRLLGYGLKLKTGFRHTHLGDIGR